MKHFQRRLQQLERRVSALSTSRLTQESPDDEFAVWCRGGCLGALPPAGLRPAKYRSDEEWQREHRFLVALCCREVGRPDPPGMSEQERREVDDVVTLFASVYPNGAFARSQRAERICDPGAMEPLPTDPGSGTVAAVADRGESP